METGLTERLRQWFGTQEAGRAELSPQELALAALLVEMMRADYVDRPVERDAVLQVLERRLHVGREAALRLMEQGERAADRAVSLFEHTHPLDIALAEDEKFGVIAALWEIALADGELDRHEDYLAHKLAELLHVRHADLMRIKDEVRSARRARGEQDRSA